MWRCGNCDALSVSELKVVRGAERTREVQQSPPARGFMSVTYRIRVGGVQDSAGGNGMDGVNEESYQARGQRAQTLLLYKELMLSSGLNIQ
ncbi:uncharacterized protein LOC132896481 isoform X4 [Neoarius graeffei]|uniref:uncharacterized protein LOC132896481 isoform X4 n=1 Tax=Neoarius graeffei TaxID=443677 RepID=UPI00298D47BC|nr:uncharacterized protein LOC132896481 isoform X4 [Neoarius graeffei]